MTQNGKGGSEKNYFQGKMTCNLLRGCQPSNLRLHNGADVHLRVSLTLCASRTVLWFSETMFIEGHFLCFMNPLFKKKALFINICIVFNTMFKITTEKIWFCFFVNQIQNSVLCFVHKKENLVHRFYRNFYKRISQSRKIFFGGWWAAEYDFTHFLQMWELSCCLSKDGAMQHLTLTGVTGLINNIICGRSGKKLLILERKHSEKKVHPSSWSSSFHQRFNLGELDVICMCVFEEACS